MSTDERKYSSVAIPKDLVEKVLELIEITKLYRTHSEFFIVAGRWLYLKTINTMYRKKKLSKKNLRKSNKQINF